MSLWKLRFSMLATLAMIIGLSTMFFSIFLSIFGTLDFFSLLFMVLLFNIAQWLFSPYLIDLLYRVREASRNEYPRLYSMIERLSEKSRIKIPKIMIANIPIPNAFAYGSPIAGSRVAVTTELLKVLEDEEVEAVIGHEIGHLKNRDVQVMMFVSILPAIFYYLGYSLMLSSAYSRRDERGGAGWTAIIGIASITVYWVLTLFTLYLSRLREYFADRHSASIVDEGSRKLSEGLAKIVYSTGRMKSLHPNFKNLNSLKALFISDPDHADSDALTISRSQFGRDQKLVDEVLSRRVTAFDRFVELFSTHPNITKRLMALKELQS
ncbi:MAG: zinc metalloprotease HtpX [Candidatus Bathyarchaeia archaeon]